jgi:hypothetical protein
MRVERETARRSNVAVVVSTLLSLVVVAAAVAAVAYLVLRTPSSAVDSAERLEPVGTAIPAPTEPPSLPTPIPTALPAVDPEPTALGFSGEQPAAIALPTVVAPATVPETLPETVPEAAGPTPTPRVIAPPTAIPPTVPPPPPTLPPSVPVADVPVVALAPVESAPPPAASSAQSITQPTPQPPGAVEADDDPFNVFEDDSFPTIVPAGDAVRDRVRALQDGDDRGGSDSSAAPAIVVPTIAVSDIVIPTVTVPVAPTRDGTIDVVMPDVDAMIEEITARATDPNRNPNTRDAGDDRNGNEDKDSRSDSRSNSKKKESAKDREDERRGRRTPAPITSVGSDQNLPVIQPSVGSTQQECADPFANLPEDMRPKNFPFDNC